MRQFTTPTQAAIRGLALAAAVSLVAGSAGAQTNSLGAGPEAAPSEPFGPQTFRPVSPDFNRDGVIDRIDQAMLFGAWGTSDPRYDLNRDGIVNSADLALLLGSPQPAFHPCDLNHDGVVNQVDVIIVLASWGQPGPIGDINGDGVVNSADLAEALGAWGQATGGA